METILRRLTAAKDDAQRTKALRALGTMLSPTDPKSPLDVEGNKMDFIMEEGFQIVCDIIMQFDASVELIREGLRVLECVASQDACHWQGIWKSIRGLTGINQLLERTTEEFDTLLVDIVRLLTRIVSFEFLDVDSTYIFKWIVLWDLILAGMERNYEDSEIVNAFFGLLDCKSLPCPSEMYPRVRFCIERGMTSHHCHEEPTPQRHQTLGRQLLARFEPQERRITTKSTETSPVKNTHIVHIPCAAAA